MDLLGRKVLMQNGAGFAALTQAIRADIAGCDHDLAADLSRAVNRLEEVTQALAAEVQADAERGLANATLYLDFTGHVVMGWMWLRLADAAARKAALDGDRDFLRGKDQTARYFFARELPRTAGWARTLLANDRSAFEMRPDWF